MRFGICTSPDNAAQLAPGTLDYIELGLSAIQKMSDGEVYALKARLSELGTPAEATNGFFPAEVRLCGARYNPETVAEYTKRALANAAELGIFTCVLGSGAARNVEEGDDRAACIAQFEEALAVVGDVAKLTGTTVVLEPLRVKEANYMNTVSEGAQICRHVNHPNILLLADYFHVMDAGEDLNVLVENRDLLRHIHIATPGLRTFPTEEDGHDYAPFAAALKTAGYDLRMSIEGGSPGDFAQIAPRAIAYLRRVFA